MYRCIKPLGVCSVNDGTLAKTRFTSTSDVPKKVVSPERALLLQFSSLHILKNEVCTMHLIKSLTDTVNNLCRKGDHINLNVSIKPD